MDLLTATTMVSVLHALLEREPRPPILVAADEGSQADVIKKVLDLGVDDVISMAAAKIPEALVEYPRQLMVAGAQAGSAAEEAADGPLFEIIKQHEQGRYTMLVSNVEVFIYTILETGRIYFPCQVMQVYAHGVHAYIFSPSQFAIDGRCIECLSLPHL